MLDSGYRTYVISLAQYPEKRSAFLERNRQTGVAFAVFDAIDGSVFAFEDCVRNGLVAADAIYYTFGAIGCAASHRALWMEAKETNSALLVFEDDAYCRRDIARQIEDVLTKLDRWDIVLLGYNTDAVLDFRISEHGDLAGVFSNKYPCGTQLQAFTRETGNVVPVRLNNAFGTCAYLVSPTGARKLLSLFPLANRPLRVPGNRLTIGSENFRCISVDMLMNTLYPSIEAYTVVPPLALALNDPSVSTTKNSPVAGRRPPRATPAVNDLRGLLGAFARVRRRAAAAVSFLRSRLSRRP